MVQSYEIEPGAIASEPGDRSTLVRFALNRMENKMSDTTILESFPAMLRRVLGERLAPELTTFPDMFAADGVLEYPYAPPGLRTPLVGRDAIVANFQIIRKLLRVDTVTDVVVHETADPQLVMLEFAGHGEGLITGEPYEQRYVSVIRLREGYIVHYKDYWNPLALLRTLKGEEILTALTMA